MKRPLFLSFIVIGAACNGGPKQELEGSMDSDPTPIERGQQVFTQNNCGSCHALKNVEGPGLTGVRNRWPSQEKLKAFIRNSSKVIADGDPYAKDLYDKWKMPMPAFPNLSGQELDDVISYINQ